MALEDKIHRQIELELRASGADASAKNIAQVEKQINALLEKQPQLRHQTEQLTSHVTNYAQSHAAATKKAQKGLAAQRVATKGLAKAFGGLDKAVKSAFNAIIGFSSFSGMIQATKQGSKVLQDYNDLLLQSSAAVAKYGQGIVQLESNLKGLSNTLNMTRKETTQLFQQYEKSFGIFSQQGFEQLAKNVRSIVGPNLEAQKEMMSGLQRLVQEYPDLQSAIESAAEADRKRLQIAAEQLVATNDLSREQFKQIQTYVQGAQQMTKEDYRRRREMEAQQETFKEFERHTERIRLQLAQAMMPIMKQLADWLKENKDVIRDVFNTIHSGAKTAVKWINKITSYLDGVKNTLSAIISLWAGGKAIQFAKGIGGIAAGAGSLAGAGGAAGAAGAAGSAATRGISRGAIAAGGSGALAAGGRVLASGGRKIGEKLGIGRAARSSVGAAQATSTAARSARTTGIGARTARAARGIGGKAAQVGGRAMGALGKTALSGAGRLMKGGGGLALAGLAGSMGGKALKSSGYKKTGQAASAAGTIAGMTGTGAMIGSIVPGLGTAAGAIGGGVAGTVYSLFQGDLGKLIGLTEKQTQKQDEIEQARKKGEKRARKQIDRVMKGQESVSEAVERQRKTEQIVSDAEQRAKKHMSVDDYKRVMKEREQTEEQVKKARQAAESRLKDDESIGSIGDREIHGTQEDIKTIESRKADLQKELEKHKTKAAAAEKDTEVAEHKKAAEIIRQKIHEVQDLKKEAEKVYENQVLANDEYVEAVRQNKKAQAQVSVLNQKYHNLYKIQERIGNLRESEVDKLDSMIQKAQTFGVKNAQRLSQQVNQAQQTYQQEISFIEDLIQKVNQKRQVDKDITAESETQINKILKETGLLEKYNVKSSTGLSHKQKMNALQSAVNKKQAESVKLSEKVAESFEGHRKLAAQNASLQKSLVDLADNFAIGIGASATMRQKAVEATEREIDYLKKKEQAHKREIEQGADSLYMRQKLRSVQEEIVNKQKEQAQMLKQLRDGWVNALGAMNTGAGKFTKIMVSQEKQMGAALRRFEALRSSYSGAVEGGYETAEQFSATQPGTIKNRKKGLAYETHLGDKDEAMAYQLQHQERAQAAKTVGGHLQERAKGVNTGGLAVMGQRHGASRMMGGGMGGAQNTRGVPNKPARPGGNGFNQLNTSGGGSGKSSSTESTGTRTVNYRIPEININVEFENLDELDDIIKKEIQKSLSRNNMASAIASDGILNNGIEGNRMTT